MSELTIRTPDGQWLFDALDPTVVSHRYGRGMWHPTIECADDLCHASPGDAWAERDKFGRDLLPPAVLPVAPALPRVFSMIRTEDVSGVSGTGIVAQGVQFRDGQVVLQWCCPGLPSSVAVWPSLEDVLTIHGHRGRTVVKWADGRD